MLARLVSSPVSMLVHGGGSSIATKVSVRGDCGKDGWVPSCGKVSLSWWFWDGVVSSPAIYVGSRLLVWVKRYVGQAIALIYSFANLCICWSSWMRPSSSVILAQLMGNFSYD